MKRKERSTDKSAPYRSLSLERSEAPVKQKGEPKSTRTEGKTDLRGGKG